MTAIVLATLNAKYIHASFGLRYLYANLGALQEKTKLLEFEISDRSLETAEEILKYNPKILGLGVYIWNIAESIKLIKVLRKVKPELIIVVGGPEVSYEIQSQEIYNLVNYVVTGEADLTFPKLCEDLLNDIKLESKIIYSPVPEPPAIRLPYDYYSDSDIKNRIVYVEASRGCPFTCEFCLSSLEIPVRAFDLDLMLSEFTKLLSRGVHHFKFVDRTFNLNLKTSKKILEFFLANYKPGLFVHFEMVPDRLPIQLREIIAKFPAGALQFEVGIQSFNPEVGILISRKQDFDKLAENLIYLKENTTVHVHADLIVGLPGETIESFASGFDKLITLGPQEIQVGILKRLRGTPIIRHDQAWGMVYSDDAPYEILKNNQIDYETMQRMRRFSRYWDLVANSGNFMEGCKLLWQNKESSFYEFLKFSDWLYLETNQRFGIALNKLALYLFHYLTKVALHPELVVAQAISNDFSRLSRKDLPDQIQIILKETKNSSKTVRNTLQFPLKRQARHLVASNE
ncbi:MAG: radical SAM protein [bacterium]|nr:radical SAM protein [bacterium]